MSCIARRIFPIFLFILFLLPVGSNASSVSSGWTVLTSQGEVSHGNKPIKVGDVLPVNGVLSTAANGKAKIAMQTGKMMILASNVKVDLSQEADDSIQLLEGSVRFINKMIAGKAKVEKGKNSIRTSNSILGTRGTDFLVVANSLLGETEIVVFDGFVHFQNSGKKDDQKEVPAGHWGGLGGRFGQRITDLIALPANVLKVFRSSLTIETQFPQSRASDEWYNEVVPSAWK
ncbi:hypothetical protein EBU99_14650 [bacterium]|nr:hypothetical protein [bacterium]